MITAATGTQARPGESIANSTCSPGSARRAYRTLRRSSKTENHRSPDDGLSTVDQSIVSAFPTEVDPNYYECHWRLPSEVGDVGIGRSLRLSTGSRASYHCRASNGGDREGSHQFSQSEPPAEAKARSLSEYPAGGKKPSEVFLTWSPPSRIAGYGAPDAYSKRRVSI